MTNLEADFVALTRAHAGEIFVEHERIKARAQLLAAAKWSLSYYTRKTSGALPCGQFEDVEIARSLAAAISAVEKAERL